MSDNVNTDGVTKWVYVVIALVAMIGLLAGLLISKTTTPEPVIQTTQVQTEIPPANGNPPRSPRPEAAEQDVRRILRNLTPERRREILQQAMKNTESSDYVRPRILMQKRQQARRKAFEIAKSEPFDRDAMRKALNEVQKLNAQMAIQGTELTVEVLQLMTREERKLATERRPNTQRDRRQQRRKDRQQKRDRD